MARLSLRRRLLYTSLASLLLLAALAAIEVAVRLTLPRVSNLELFVAAVQQKAQVADAAHSAIFEGDPLLAWRLKPDLDRVFWDYTLVTTNSRGLRADGPVGRKEPGAFRVVCAGDSVTFGYRVPVVWPDKPTSFDPEWLPYPRLLERALRAANPATRIDVVPLAVPGYTSHQGRAWLGRELDALDPDVVTLCYGWNDASTSDHPDREAIPTDAEAFAVRWLLAHSQALAHVARFLRARTPRGSAMAAAPRPRVDEPEYVDNVLDMVRRARARGAAVVVMAAPYRDGATNPPEAERMTRYREALRAALASSGDPLLEIPELTEKGSPANASLFGELVHPSEGGHRLIARVLLAELAARGALKGLAVPR